jgi:hypothetical protein
MSLLALLFGGALSLVRRALGFLGALSPRTLAFIAGATLLAATGWHIHRLHMRIDAAVATIAEREKTIAEYRVAQTLAEKAQAENLDRAARAQTAITERISHDHEIALADWRTRFDVLRRTTRNSRASGAVALPAPSQGPGKPDDSNHDPAGIDTVAVKIDDLQTLVEGALRGRDLQSWVGEQEGVATSPADLLEQVAPR